MNAMKLSNMVTHKTLKFKKDNCAPLEDIFVLFSVTFY